MNKALTGATYLVKKLWLSCALLLVVFAVLLSVLRYSLPYLDAKKHYIEDYLNAQYGVELSIGGVSAIWQGTGPSIVLNDVKLAQNALSPVLLKVEEVYVEVDFWQSLLQRKLSSKRFDLVGLHATIDTQRTQASGDGDFPIIDALKNLFLLQLQRFSLLHGEVVLVTPTHEKVIELSQLLWVNQKNRHQGRGHFRLKDLANDSASFVLDLYGDTDDFSGVLYAQGESLDISPWASAWVPSQPVESSSGNFQLWAELENEHLTSVQIKFEDSDIAWRTAGDKSILHTQLLGGEIQALPTDFGWSLRVDNLILQANSNTVVTDLVGKVDEAGTLTINTIKPVSVAPILSLAPLFTPGKGGEILDAMQPTGELATLQLQWQQRQLSVAAKLLDIDWQQSGKIPGVEALNAELFWHHDHGVLNVKGHNTQLTTDNLLPQNLAMSELNGQIYLYPDLTQQWTMALTELTIATDLVDVIAKARYQFSDHFLEATLDVSPMPLNQVPKLFPKSLMGAGTVSYLTRALAGEGQLAKASALFYGAPKEFPFEENQGVFQASVDVLDADFKFSRTWPAIRQVDGHLMFENAGLTITAPSALLNGINVTDIRAKIPRLASSAVLSIEAEGAGSGEQVTDLMLASSISHTLGKVLDRDISIEGPLTAKLHLDIPLRGKDVKASGIAKLAGNEVTVNSIDVNFNNVVGDLHFNNANLTIDAMEADLLNQPVTIELTSNQLSDDYLLDIQLAGNWQVEPLVERFKPSYSEYLAGTSAWQADVSVSLSQSDFQYHASLTSDLAGLSSQLPAPFLKSAEQQKKLMLLAEGDQQGSLVNLNVDDDIYLNGELNHLTRQFTHAHLALGDSDMVRLGSGFSISAAMDKVDLSDWYRAIQLLVKQEESDAIPASTDANKMQLFTIPDRVFIEADEFLVSGQTLTNTAITAKQQNNNWNLDVVATEARAEVKLFDAWQTQGIDIDADFIRLDTWQSASSSSDVKQNYLPQDLPPIRFHCSDCVFLDRDFGEIYVDAIRNEQGLALSRLQAQNKFGKLMATGQWESIGGVSSQTAVTGTVKSNNIGGLLGTLGFDSGIKDSKANIEFDLNWLDAPFNYDSQTLNGTVKTGLTDGYLTQVSDKGSRIFTLFSFNSLVRKLSLDFRDVFAKGFFYDDIKGSLTIVDGIASTTDTVVDGAVGEIEIKGYTDLTNQTLDYNISFAPNVTGNLPFLVYFMVNPPTALAALALDQVLTSAKVISNVNYNITGTLDNPVFNEVGRDSKDIALPARRDDIEPSPVVPEGEAELPAENDLDQSLNKKEDTGADS